MDKVEESAAAYNIATHHEKSRTEQVLGMIHHYLLEAQNSPSEMAVIETTMPPGHGVPPHIHTREDETFYVIEGVLEVKGDDLQSPIQLKAGDFFYGPRGRQHGIFNPSSGNTRILVTAIPGGNIQRMFHAMATLSDASETPPSHETIFALCKEYGIIFP